MLHSLRRGFFAALSGTVGVFTLFWPDWLEKLFGVDPDHGSGWAEWLVIAVLLIVSITLGIIARIEWRSAARAKMTGPATHMIGNSRVNQPGPASRSMMHSSYESPIRLPN